MQDSPTDISMDAVVTRSNMVARRIADDLSWGEGAILPQNGSQETLLTSVIDAIEPVADDEEAFSSCTDGRLPVQLANGDPVPVREQLVGADIVSAFYVAEMLGKRFYADPAAPVAERLAEVADFLRENGIMPSSHLSCGAAGGFVPVVQNIVRFSDNPAFIARLKALLPEGVYSDELQTQLVRTAKERLESGAYDGIDPQLFLDAAEHSGGKQAIAELKDDGRGVHGHMEEAIVRLRVPGKAIDVASLANATGGRQVFGVNDTRMERLARLFARGSDQDYRLASIALEHFASSGHATLAKDLPTYIVAAA